MQDSFSFNKLLATGMVTGLILLGIAAIYAVRVMELHTETTENRTNGNPLIYEKEGYEPLDSGVPQIPGVKIYSAKNDADQILLESKQSELDFKKRSTAKFADKEQAKYIKQMKQKNEFAAERLAFLQKIEVATTKEERLRLIEELRILSEEKKKEPKQQQPLNSL